MAALMRTCVGAAGRTVACGAGASGGGWGGSLARISRLSRSCRTPAPVTVCVRGQHSLPDLPYDYDALEPVISAEIMRLHHSKHHQTYVNNLNVAEARLQEAVAKHDVSTVVALQPALRFNGGGHINHSIFWQNLRPVSGPAGGVCLPEGALLTAIQQDFGGVDQLQQRLSTAAVGVQGSGWAWLAYDPQRRCLCVSTCANQDPLQATTGQLPLFGIDVWEHAYYLQYKNARADYVREIFKIANWPDVAARLAKATADVQ